MSFIVSFDFIKKYLSILVVPVVILSIIILPGCADYRAVPLKIPKMNNKEGIQFSYYTFNKADCKTYLGRNVFKIGYQPLQLTIFNNTDHAYTITNFSLPIASADDIAKQVHTSTTGRAVGYGAAAVLTCGLFAIPAIVDGVGSSKANERLDDDFSRKTLRFDSVIKPHQILNGIVFVPVAEFSEDFTITMLNVKTNKILVLSSMTGEIELENAKENN